MNLSVNLDICRVCMKSKQCHQLLGDINLSKRWIFTTHLSLDENDNLPKQLCDKCLIRLKLSYEFVSLAHSSDKNLRGFLAKIRKDFRQVTCTNTNIKTDDEEVTDDVDDNDDLLTFLDSDEIDNGNTQASSIIKTNKSNCKKIVNKTTTTAATTPVVAAAPSQLAKAKTKKLHAKEHKPELKHTQPCSVDLETQITAKNVKHEAETESEADVEAEQAEAEADREPHEFDISTEAINTDEDEQFQLYDVNFVDTVEALDGSVAIEAQLQREQNSINEENTQISIYAEEEESIDEAEVETQNTLEIAVANQVGSGDGFLKEYDGSMSEDEHERVDYIEDASMEEMHLYETDDMQAEDILENKETNEKLETMHCSHMKDMLETTTAKIKATRKPHYNRNGGTKARVAIPASTRFFCVKCNRDFSTKTNLTRHMTTHEGIRPYKCDECGKTFTQNGSLKQHMFTHTGEKPFVCEFCNRGFSQSKSLIFHLRRHTGHKPFHCDFCGLDFRQKDGLKTHILRHHMDQSYGGNDHLCIICKKTMESKKALQIHMKQHVNNHKLLEVDIGYQPGEQNAAVILELIDESDINGEKGLITDELSLNVSNISSSTHVIDVIATSATEPSRAKKYQCRRCFKCFAIKKNLIRHLSIHDMGPSEMFQCNSCQIAFDSNYALKLHRVREHKETGINFNECEECRVTFYNASDMNKHMETVHKYSCSECPDLNFKTQKLLMEHMLEHELNDIEEDLKAQ